MYVRDLQGNEYPVMATYTMNDEINGNMDLSIELLPNKVNSVFLKEISELWEVITEENVCYKVIYSKTQGIGTKLKKSIRAIPKLYDDLNTTRIYPKYEGSFSIEELFSIVFKPTNYVHQLVGSWTNIEIEGFGDGDNCLSMFQTVLNRIGAEFTFTDDVVIIREKIGSDSQIMYRHRLNASNIMPEIDAQEYWTYAKGFGNYSDDENEGGWENAKLLREYTSPLAKLLGKREAPPIKDGRMTKSTTMDNALKTLVDDSIKISVTADLVDLRKKNYPYAQSALGDVVTLIDERIGLQEEVRVAARSIKRDWRGTILDVQFTFGTQGLAKRYNAQISNAAKEMTDILSGKKKLPFPAMAAELQIVSKLLKNVQTQLSVAEDGSLLAIDKNNPNLLVILNAAGIGVSDDGGQTFKNAITGRGILGDRIIANSITADKLDTNAITVGFNNHSTNLKLWSNRLEFYRDNLMSATLNENGMEFWYGSRKIGRVGETAKMNDADVRGVALNLEYTGDYITFGRKESSTAKEYSTLFVIDPLGKMTGVGGIHSNLDFVTDVLKGSAGMPMYIGTTKVDGQNYPAIGSQNFSSAIAFGNGALWLIEGSTAYRVSNLTK